MGTLKNSMKNSRLDKMKKALEAEKNDTKLNLNIPHELHHRFRVKAITEGTTMTNVIISAIEKYVK